MDWKLEKFRGFCNIKNP